jgi:hypothetical protein
LVWKIGLSDDTKDKHPLPGQSHGGCSLYSDILVGEPSNGTKRNTDEAQSLIRMLNLKSVCHYCNNRLEYLKFEVSKEVTTAMLSSWTLRRVGLVRTDVSEERIASIVKETRICEVGKMLAVNGNYEHTFNKATKFPFVIWPFNIFHNHVFFKKVSTKRQLF